jgi:exosortase/archaeosortase family protein
VKTNKFIILFVAKAIGLYLLWYLIYDLWLKKVGVLDTWIIDSIVYFTVKILELFGYLLFVDYHAIGLPGAYSNVFIGNGCNGLELFVLFTGFILIFKGSWKDKVWFVPLGIIIIHFLNVLRVIGLIFSGRVSVDFLAFNHKYTFTILLYIITFIGWLIWVKYFSEKEANKKSIDAEIES